MVSSKHLLTGWTIWASVPWGFRRKSLKACSKGQSSLATYRGLSLSHHDSLPRWPTPWASFKDSRCPWRQCWLQRGMSAVACFLGTMCVCWVYGNEWRLCWPILSMNLWLCLSGPPSSSAARTTSSAAERGIPAVSKTKAESSSLSFCRLCLCSLELCFLV